MSRVWGRLVKASLSNSKKLAKCSERNALIYNFTLTHHDGEGRLEVDDASILSMCGLFAIQHDWTKEDMAAAREEISGVGLWRLYETKDGQHCAEVVDWENAQRLDRIKRGSKILDESEAVGKSDGSAMEVSGKLVGSGTDKRAIEDKRSEINKREEGENARAREEQKSIPPSHEISGARRQETAMIELDVIRDFMAAHPQGEKCIIRRWDRDAIPLAAHALAQLPDRVGFFERALASLSPERQTLEAAIECLNNPKVVCGSNGSGPSKKFIEENERAIKRAIEIGAAKKRLIEQGNPRPTFEEIDAEYLRATT